MWHVQRLKRATTTRRRVSRRFCDDLLPGDPGASQAILTPRVWSLRVRRRAVAETCHGLPPRRGRGPNLIRLFVKPETKLSVADVFALMRDHYEGPTTTMTKGLDAGPLARPTARGRSRGRWTGRSTPGSGRSRRPRRPSPSSRSRAPGCRTRWAAVCWYGLDDTYFVCYVPLYCGITAVPECTPGRAHKFSW